MGDIYILYKSKSHFISGNNKRKYGEVFRQNSGSCDMISVIS